MKTLSARPLATAALCLLIAIGHAIPAEKKPFPQSSDAGTNAVFTPQKFAEQAAWMELKEIGAGQLALKQSQNVEVRDLANQMIRDHSVSHRQLTRIAEQNHWRLPPTNAFSGDIRLLGTLSGQEFDRAYVAELVTDHAKAVQAFEAAERVLEAMDLRKFVNDTLPTLRTHHHLARKLAEKVGAPASLDANRRLRHEP